MVVTNKFVLKGQLLGAIQFRNVFYGDLDLHAPDTYYDVWVPYVTSIYNHISTYLSSALSFWGYDLYHWVAGEWAFIEAAPLTYAGTSSADPLPNAVAAVLIGKSSGKRHIGRKFISGFTETYSAGNAPTVAVLADLAAAALDYITPVTTANGSVLQPGVMSRGGTFRAFSGGVVSALWGSMRRRKPGIGI